MEEKAAAMVGGDGDGGGGGGPEHTYGCGVVQPSSFHVPATLSDVSTHITLSSTNLDHRRLLRMPIAAGLLLQPMQPCLRMRQNSVRSRQSRMVSLLPGLLRCRLLAGGVAAGATRPPHVFSLGKGRGWTLA